MRMTCSLSEKLLPPPAPLYSVLPHHPLPSLNSVSAQVKEICHFLTFLSVTNVSHLDVAIRIMLLFTHLPITIVIITFK